MKNLKLFFSINRAYILSFLIFSFLSFLFYFAFSIDFRVFLYCLIILFFIFLFIGIFRFFKAKKCFEKNSFSYFEKNLYEIHLKEIFERKEKEIENLRISSKLRQNDLENLLTIWTHQIKTPLSSISLISEREENYDIKRELIRIDDYIASILSFIKLGQDSLDYSFKSFSIEKLIKDIVKRYRSFFIHKNLKLILDIEDENIVSDPKWLGLVLEQVLFNAIKYTDKGYIKISYHDFILTIEDSGIGIKKEDLKNINKFGFSGDSDKRNANSTGIGLFLVNDILKKLGYAYKIESKGKEGTIFSLNLKKSGIIEN
ncbi:histidine kinase [Anaerococcus sp. HMSC075B03]|nr:histidine kinase [Anaerococcus sp. HMSC075B03]